MNSNTKPAETHQGLRHFLVALQFFTRVPITGSMAAWVGYSPEMLRASSTYYPAVGWLIGCVAALAMTVALALFPAGGLGVLVAACLSTIVTVWLTGAFHEDGLADTADGLGGYVARERSLEIMKDSRIGTYGTVTLGLALMLKVLLLAMIAQSGAWGVAVALLAAHALSRLAPLVVIRTMPYASDPDQSKSKPLADSLTGQEFRVACWWSLPALILLLQAHGVAHLLLALVLWVAALAYMMRLLRQRLQGFTGDTLGATQQLCELAIYLALAMQWA